MREITSHHVNPLNAKLKIEAIDLTSNAGAHCHYHISGFDSSTNDSVPPRRMTDPAPTTVDIFFQNGNPNDPAVGANGITHEVLLAVLIDRLEGFQSGPFAHERNAAALASLKEAATQLSLRTAERIERGVEGQRVE